MSQFFVDVSAMSKAFDSLSELTGLSYSLYDDRNNLLIPPSRDDVVLSAIRKHFKGRELLSSFLARMLSKAVTMNDAMAVQGPTDQYHVFIPMHLKGITVVVVAEAFYPTNNSYIEFCVRKGITMGIEYESIAENMVKVRIMPLDRVQETLKTVRPLLDGILASGYEKGELRRQSHWLKVVSSLMTSMKQETPLKDVYKTVIEATSFVFSIDTSAIFSARNGSLVVDYSSGRTHDLLKDMRLDAANPLVAKVFQTKMPLAVMDTHEILHAGFHEDIISMYLFPIMTDKALFGMMGIFNTLLDKDVFESIQNLCKVLAQMLESRASAYRYYVRYESLRKVFEKAPNLLRYCQTPDELHKAIVAEAVQLAQVEKCSLMLPGEDENTLSVAAVHGTMKELMQDVFVHPGEGIAGKAYQTGAHIMINSESELKKYVPSVKPSYKTSSCLSLPIVHEGDTIGVLNLADKIGGKGFTDEDVLVLQHFLTQAFVMLKLSGYFEDIRRMKDASLIDSITRLFNRRYFDVRVEEEFQRSKRHKHSFAIALVRIDHLKGLSEKEGTSATHGVLHHIASSMKNAIRVNDVATRFGDESFALIMPQTNSDEAIIVMDRIRTEIKQLPLPAWKNFDPNLLTMTTGIASYPECEGPAASIIRAADKALYQAINEGPNKLAVWSSKRGNVVQSDGECEEHPSGDHSSDSPSLRRRTSFIIPAED